MVAMVQHTAIITHFQSHCITNVKLALIFGLSVEAGFMGIYCLMKNTGSHEMNSMSSAVGAASFGEKNNTIHPATRLSSLFTSSFFVTVL